MLLLYFLSGIITSNHRLGTTYLKQNRLTLIEGRKLILVGGSNLHYGINSEMLESGIGIEVVNMGIQGSIGLEYYFNEIMDKVKENDVVVFLPEPALFYKIPLDGEQTLYNLISKFPKGICYLNFDQILSSPKYLGMTIKENLEYFVMLITMKLLNRKTILEETNELGDYLGHKNKKSIYSSKIPPANFVISEVEPRVDSTVLFLIKAAARIKSKGAQFYISFSPTAKSAEEFEIFQVIDNKISEIFSTVKLSSIFENIYPDYYFLDTSHHLLYDKRNERTQILINQLICNKIFNSKLIDVK